jgi:hypothetical protein
MILPNKPAAQTGEIIFLFIDRLYKLVAGVTEYA